MRWMSLISCMVLAFAADTGPNQDVITLSDGTKCGLEGTAKSSDGKALDRLKNRYKHPNPNDVDQEVSLAVLLAPGDDVDRFDPKRAATLTGYVIDVKVGGKETCNCRATAAMDRDTHIELALAKDAPEIQRIIVEVTPRLRAQMKDQQVDWTTNALRTRIKGKWVKLTGWLLFDTMHILEAENTNPGGAQNWRATCWEMHPVTSIEVLPGLPAGTVELAPAVLKEFHRAHVVQMQRAPKQREALEARNKKLLEGFAKEDFDEDLPKR